MPIRDPLKSNRHFDGGRPTQGDEPCSKRGVACLANVFPDNHNCSEW
jgi:hypothetical protein